MTLDEVLRNEELIQEVNGKNDNLINYLKRPDIAKQMIRVIETQPADADEFGHFKAPYQAAECLCDLEKEALIDLLKCDEVVETLFDLVNDKLLTKTYILCKSLISREAGYMAKIVSAFVAASPSSVYKYLAAHASSIIANLVKNMMHCGTLDVIRFLLDVPLESAPSFPP